MLKVAHAGLLAIVKVSVCPSGSEAVGVKLYACPAVAVVGGVPLITGGRFADVTWMLKTASETCAAPSDTEIEIFDVVPTCAVVGVPERRPVDELNEAQAGRLAIANVSVWPSGSDAVGAPPGAL